MFGSVLLVGCTSECGTAQGPIPSRARSPTSKLDDPPSTHRARPADDHRRRRPRPSQRGSGPQRRCVAVRHLANDIGPRPGTSPAFAEAAGLGADAVRETSGMTSGGSGSVPRGQLLGNRCSGRPQQQRHRYARRLRPAQPHLIIGAHLDTVPQAPGAEDNASGVSVVLELARMASIEAPATAGDVRGFRLRGTTGKRRRPASFRFARHGRAADSGAAPRPGRDGFAGSGRCRGVVPVSTGGLEPPTIRDQLIKAADRVGVAAFADEDNQASDHWSFDKAGLPAARVGSTPYAGYHSAADVPAVVNPAQLERVGTLLWAWMRGPVSSE